MPVPMLQLVRTVLIGLAVTLPGAAAWAQEPDKSTDDRPALPEAALKAVQERLERIEREILRLQGRTAGIPADAKDRGVFTLLETPFLGTAITGAREGTRFLAARLMFVNLTDQPITVERGDIVLSSNGVDYPLDDVPKRLQFQAFSIGNENYRLSSLNPALQTEVPAGGTGTTWVVFAELPQGTDIPPMILKLKLGDKESQLNVNDAALSMLGLKVERIGPRGALGLLTISSTMNTINVGGIVEALDSLANQKVARAVVNFSDSATPLDSELLNWLQRAASRAGTNEPTNNRFPTVSAGIRELHVANLPNTRGEKKRTVLVQPGTFVGTQPDAQTMHATAAEAIEAALQSAYAVLPREELLKEIQEGNTLTRAAAMSAGGGRLTAGHLPLLTGYADDADPLIQNSALRALRHFGEEPAVAKLTEYVRKGNEPFASTAIESLAASRYEAAHQALLSILQNEPPESKRKIVEILAQYPRPIWSDTIYEYARDPQSTVGAVALSALVRIGHPKLVEVLQKALEGGNAGVKNEAFNLLASRNDPESERIAINYSLTWMESNPPNSQILNLLNRTREPRAVPLLLKHFESMNGNRTEIIGTLANIGDQTVAQLLVEKYPQMKNFEQTATLQALQMLRSSAFRQLAEQALASTDASLISAACRGLQTEATPEAVTLLAAALDKTDNNHAWSHITNALSTLATPEARVALRKARDSGVPDKRNFAINALQNMERRSPGYQYVYQAQLSVQGEKWDEAIFNYTMAVMQDPDLSSAYSGRANVYLRQEKYQEARQDFAKSLELDPFDTQGITGLGIVLVQEGSYREGVKFIEDARAKFNDDQIFAYNMACVYGRALEKLEQDTAAADRDALIQKYREQAIADLKRSIELGFADYEWIRKDPDLKSLHNLPEFKAVHTPIESVEEQEPAEEDDGLIDNPF